VYSNSAYIQYSNNVQIQLLAFIKKNRTMDINLIGSIASIVSLIISIIVVNKVIKITNILKINDSSVKQQKTKIKGDKNIVSGKNTTVSK
jgi:hypothetical protein